MALVEISFSTIAYRWRSIGIRYLFWLQSNNSFFYTNNSQKLSSNTTKALSNLQSSTQLLVSIQYVLRNRSFQLDLVLKSPIEVSKAL
jgi:hypothetical protein